MRPDPQMPEAFSAADPRDEPGAETGGLATRMVLPLVTQRRPLADTLGLVAGIGVIALLGMGTLWSMNAARLARQQAPQRKAAAAAPLVPTAPPPVLASRPAPVLPMGASPLPPSAASAAPMVQPPANNPRSTPTLVFDAGAGAEAAPLSQSAGAAPGGNGNSNDDFTARVGAAGGISATARASFDPRTTISQGTLIPAVLETAIDTDVPGYARAVVSEDVRSFDGSRVLVPRSSRLIGQYKSGMQAGQKRAYVIWTRIIRADGVSVNIGSPGVDFSGASGLPGKVDTHFFERFGSAMLLSVIGGLSSLGGNTAIIIGGSGQSAAAAAVGQTGAIGPTVRIHQGEPIRVFTARDLDFSKVPAP